MGTSTDAEITYGIKFEEDYEFPWGDVDDLDEWWLRVCGYQPPFEIYDEHGEYLNGVEPTEEQSDAYYEHRSKFEKKHPLPIELVNYCSGGCPMWIVAIKNAGKIAHRGYPTAINPEKDFIVDPKWDTTLLDFCKTHGLEPDGSPAWWLSSYWSS